MPTILYVQGWRFYFYSNESNEPMHVHAVKGRQNASIGGTRTVSISLRILNTSAHRAYDARCAR
jgi:hypothetical protein